MTIDNNAIAQELFGSHHANLARIEQGLDVTLSARGNEVALCGTVDGVSVAGKILQGLCARLEKNLPVGLSEVDAALRMASAPEDDDDDGGDDDGGLTIHTRNRQISPRSTNQAKYLRAIDRCELAFGLGPAGTGKTYLAVAKAVEALIRGEVDRVILSRPAVEAGEQLGFLPGDMREKVDPYLRPLYDALHDMLPGEQVAKYMESGTIEVAPLAFMRGRTLSHAFVILDEAQNTTAVQMKMFLTRLGENARMVVTGDLTQVDLPRGTRSGLRDAIDTLGSIKGIGVVRFTDKDVVRHPLVAKIVRAYDKADDLHQSDARYKNPEATDRNKGLGAPKP